MIRLKPGDVLGFRGPFGRGWPVEQARGRNLLMVTGGIGCAPTNAVIDYALRRRAAYGHIAICHGVNRPQDLIYGPRFDRWGTAPDTQVLLASVQGGPGWRGRAGMVTALLQDVRPEVFSGIVMMCGPEIMLRAVSEELLKQGTDIEDIYVSMERNMQCALGHCGNCQYGREFVCKDGPVFPYERVRKLMHVKGY
jgi:NAD(P)H-flavin reductase